MKKLNVGCGADYLEGYINIDIRISKLKAPDLQCDIRKIPYEHETIDEIKAKHVLEHIGRHEAVEALELWYKLLKKGGKVDIICPNILDTFKEYIEGNTEVINIVYGLQRNQYDFHKFGYCPKSLKQLLEKIGFTEVEQIHDQDLHMIGIK